MDQQVGGTGILVLVVNPRSYLVRNAWADDDSIRAGHGPSPSPEAVHVQLKRAVGLYGADGMSGLPLIRDEVDRPRDRMVGTGDPAADLG
jgi:hypothetical protein